MIFKFPAKRYQDERWHLWFAWYPVVTNDGYGVWLSRCHRKFVPFKWFDGYSMAPGYDYMLKRP